jgi:hypothetical protein
VFEPMWLVGQFVQCSLQVREVVEVGRTGCWGCERLSPGERVHREGENSWKEPYSCHRAWRIPVWYVAETQGKGG